jgi:hypothetical protein
MKEKQYRYVEQVEIKPGPCDQGVLIDGTLYEISGEVPAIEWTVWEDDFVARLLGWELHGGIENLDESEAARKEFESRGGVEKVMMKGFGSWINDKWDASLEAIELGYKQYKKDATDYPILKVGDTVKAEHFSDARAMNLGAVVRFARTSLDSALAITYRVQFGSPADLYGGLFVRGNLTEGVVEFCESIQAFKGMHDPVVSMMSNSEDNVKRMMEDLKTFALHAEMCFKYKPDPKY